MHKHLYSDDWLITCQFAQVVGYYCTKCGKLGTINFFPTAREKEKLINQRKIVYVDNSFLFSPRPKPSFLHEFLQE